MLTKNIPFIPEPKQIVVLVRRSIPILVVWLFVSLLNLTATIFFILLLLEDNDMDFYYR
jgi:hypothetical protein